VTEKLTGPDGQQIPVDDPAPPEFRKAMDRPEDGQPDYPAPPRRDPAAPHGRGQDGQPLAPYGHKADGIPRVNPPGPGRGKGDRPREQKPGDTKPGTGTPAAVPDPETLRGRRAEDATQTLQLLSAGGTLFAMITGARAQTAMRKATEAGSKEGQKKAAAATERSTVLQLDAAACALHADDVGPALADVAGHNPVAAALVDRLSLFNGAAAVGIAIMPLIYQVVANHAPKEVRDDLPPELMTLGVLPPDMLLEKLKAQNAVKMARAQSAVLAERQAAEDELQRLRDEMAA
jgi:hypothetical protein